MIRPTVLIFSLATISIFCNNNHFQQHLDNAIAYKKNKNFLQAEQSFKAAIAINPYNFTTHWGLAITYHLQDKLEAAGHKYETALKIQPHHHGALMRLAKIRKDQGHYLESMELYQKMITNNPNDRLAQAGYTQVRLQYETERFSHCLQNGGSVENKTIMIRYEWNLGDTMQFIRYAQVLKNHGANVIVFPQPCLAKLLSNCPYIDRVLRPGQKIPEFDFQVSLVYLPGIVEFIETAPNIEFPYLFVDEQLVKRHNQLPTKTPNRTILKVGLCWCGALHDHERFISLKQLMTLNDPRIDFFSLQMGSGSEQVAQLPEEIVVHTFGPDFDKTNGSFMDTAAVMKNLDLVITIDTSLAHLAGGLGVPVWVLLPHKPAWRWIKNKLDILEWVRPHYKPELEWMGLVGDSAWFPSYPTMKLFQQPKPDDWNSVLLRVKKELADTLHRMETNR